LSIPIRLSASNPLVPFTIFSTSLMLYFFLSYLVRSPILWHRMRVAQRFPYLAYFISVTLIVFPDRALSFKGFTPYYTQSVGTKNSYILKTSRRPRIIRGVFSSIFDLCAIASLLLESSSPSRIDFSSSSSSPSPSPCSTLPQIHSSRYCFLVVWPTLNFEPLFKPRARPVPLLPL
jgi:hypothetical protein